jgi:hypothetical protein
LDFGFDRVLGSLYKKQSIGPEGVPGCGMSQCCRIAAKEHREQHGVVEGLTQMMNEERGKR